MNDIALILDDPVYPEYPLCSVASMFHYPRRPSVASIFHYPRRPSVASLLQKQSVLDLVLPPKVAYPNPNPDAYTNPNPNPVGIGHLMKVIRG